MHAQCTLAFAYATCTGSKPETVTRLRVSDTFIIMLGAAEMRFCTGPPVMTALTKDDEAKLHSFADAPDGT